MQSPKISILHPFTPKAAGVVEESVALYHSKPHRKALELVAMRDGYDCSIEYFTHRLFPYSFTDEWVRTRFYPVTITLSGNHKKWRMQRSMKCLKDYYRNTPDVTIINMSAHSSWFSHSLARQILEFGKKYVAMVGGQHYTDSPANREYYTQANHILVHTYSQKQEMLKMEMFKDADIRIFPLGVDCRYFSPEPTTSDSSMIKLLFIGRIVEWKRPHLALEVVRELKKSGKQVILRLVGPTSSESYLQSLHKLVKEYSLNEEVKFEGYKNHDEVRDIIRNSDLLLLPSENETFGMVIVECMACGVPVAGVRGGHGPNEVIKNTVNGVLTDASQYVQEVVSFLNMDNQKRRTIKANARNTTLERFNIEDTYQILRKSVEDCLK